MRIVQIGTTIACAEAALLLMRFGGEVIQCAGSDPGDRREVIQLFEECLAIGKQQLNVPADAIHPADIAAIVERADIVLDDHPLSFWLQRGVNVKAMYANSAPHAHWCAITPYGLVGAGAEWPGCELTYQASGPIMNRIGEPNRSPLPIKGPQAAIAAGWHAALVSAASEYGRNNAGPGSLIDISIQECQFMHAELGPSNWHFNGIDIGRQYTAERPNVYPSLDGVIHMLFHDREWPRVARMIDRLDLAHDHRFLTRYERSKHMDEVEALLVPWFMERTRLQAVEAGQAAGMPIALEQTAVQVLSDSQLHSRRAFETLHTSRGAITFPIAIGTFAGQDVPVRRDGLDASAAQALEDLMRDWTPRPLNMDVAPANPVRPLEGVRIVDLTNTWAGPRGATMLGDLGADVIKVEGIAWMDMLRGFTNPPEGHASYPGYHPGDKPWDRYLMWLGLSRNKRSVTVELTKPEGRRILDELVAACDVVLTNMSMSTRAKHNLTYESLKAVNPKIIYATLSGYGDDGPRASWRLFGDGQAAIAGVFNGTGYVGEEAMAFGAYGDPVNGVSFAYQVVAALNLCRETGRGTWIDLSSVETCLNYSVRSLLESQLGLDSESNVELDAGERWPHGVFRCLGEDRWIAISCGSDAERKGLLDALTVLGEHVPPDVKDGTATKDTWQEMVAAAAGRHGPEKLAFPLRRRGVPVQKVMKSFDADADASLGSRRFITWLWREDLGSYPVHSPFWMINGQRPPVAVPPPTYGEHNTPILAGMLGKNEQELAQLRENGVIGETPEQGAELGLRSQ